MTWLSRKTLDQDSSKSHLARLVAPNLQGGKGLTGFALTRNKGFENRLAKSRNPMNNNKCRPLAMDTH
jgi:hypothetical protein